MTGRVCCVFGLPYCGSDTAVQILCEATEMATAVIPDLDEILLEAAIKYCDVVFIEPFEPSVEAVQWLFDNHYLSAADKGCIVQIWVSDETSLNRSAKEEEPLHVEDLKKIRADWEAVEKRIRQLNIPYYTIPAEQEPERVVANLARKTGITER